MIKIKKFYLLTIGLLFLYSLFFFIVKNFFDVSVYYHPDSLHYILDSAVISHDVFNGFASINGKIYYLYVNLLNSELYLVIFLNIFYYSLNGFIFFNSLLSGLQKIKSFSEIIIIFILLYVCDLYMLHISSTPLKESLTYLLVSIISILIYNRRFYISAFFIIILFEIRYVSILYILPFITKKIFYFLLFIIFLFSYIYYEDILRKLHEFATVNTHSRSYDLIDNYSQEGYRGLIKRFIIWPFILYTGLYLYISFSIEFLFIFPGIFLKVIFILYRKSYLNFLSLYFLTGIIAAMAPGFTSFVRYSYPLIISSLLYCCLGVQEIKKNYYCCRTIY